MTADTMFDRVLALMFSDSSDKSEMTNSYLAILNIILAENYDTENGIRGDSDPLTEPPIITNLSDEIPYNERITSYMPYGIAGTLVAEDDMDIAMIYKQKYEKERKACVTARYKGVIDVYG